MKNAVMRATAETTTNLSNEELVPSNDTSGPLAGRNVDELREKIKSARLEKLMARQLESELGIDNLEIEEVPGEDLQPIEDLDDPKLASYDEEQNFDFQADAYDQDNDIMQLSANHSRTIQMQRTQRTCEEMVDGIRSGSEILSALADQAGGLSSFLKAAERDIAALTDSKQKVKSLQDEVENIRHAHQEAKAAIKKQERQIELLESMRKNHTKSQDSAKREISQLQESVRRKDREINSLQISASNAEHDRDALKSKLSKLNIELQQSNEELSASREKLRKKEMELANQQGDMQSISAEKNQAQEKLAEVQSKYNEINKRGLEQQGQQYAKIHELENKVREMKRQLDLGKQEKAELAVELSAANNLLVLHEEMIEALSPESTVN